MIHKQGHYSRHIYDKINVLFNDFDSMLLSSLVKSTLWSNVSVTRNKSIDDQRGVLLIWGIKIGICLVLYAVIRVVKHWSDTTNQLSSMGLGF